MTSHRAQVPNREAFDLKVEPFRQLGRKLPVAWCHATTFHRRSARINPIDGNPVSFCAYSI